MKMAVELYTFKQTIKVKGFIQLAQMYFYHEAVDFQENSSFPQTCTLRHWPLFSPLVFPQRNLFTLLVFTC